MKTPPPDQGDIVILAYISIFAVISALLIVREGRLGWAMFSKNICYAIAFGWSTLRMIFPQFEQSPQVRDGIRWMIAAALTWAVVELCAARYILWRQHGADPRLIIGLRETVVGRREWVATRRERVVGKREDHMNHMKEE